VETEIIVVDGASFDGCGEMLAREFPYVRFVQSMENVGFGRANNLGVRVATGAYLLLLNPDTQFFDRSLAIMLAAADQLPEAGALGCRLRNRDGSLQTSAVQAFPTVINQVLDSDFLRRCFPTSRLWGMAPLFASERSAPIAAEAISGACVLVRRSRFLQVGGFTEAYFMYGEDLDLSFKLSSAGYPSYLVPAAQVTHFGGGSTSKAASNFSTVMMRSSVHRFFTLNRGTVAAFAYRLTCAVSALARLLLILPLLLLGRRIVRHGFGSLRKWMAVLRWSLGFQPEHPGSRFASAPAGGQASSASKQA